MNRTFKLSVIAGAVALLALPLCSAQGQGGGITVDPALAKLGKTTFANKGCVTCHSIGQGVRAGPDLLGVTATRDLTWLKNWLKDPATMLQTDSLAQALLAQAKGVKMPNLKLSEREIDGLLHYIQQESDKKKH
jgi:mono/diheme cytochrome c family protein